METNSERLQTEIAHFLYADIVGYSRELLEEQVRRKRILAEIARNAPEFQRATQHNNVYLSSTGDGFIMEFRDDYTSPIRCAVQIAAALKPYPEMSLRMGIHSGAIARTESVSGSPDVTGEGINLGERVMSNGGGGHILLSEANARLLLTSAEWQESLHRLGEFPVKHGVLVLYNFYNGTVGNPTMPAKLPAVPLPLIAGLHSASPPEQASAVGGAMPIDSAYYVERPSDARFLEAIEQQHSIASVKGARQMGKTSLLARGLQRARDMGRKVVTTDFQEFNIGTMASADTLLRALAYQIAEEFNLAVTPDVFWNSSRDANANLRRYLAGPVLGAFSEPMVWGMDEVDRLFAYPYANDFFSLIRAFHNRRATERGEHWSRLTIALAHSTEPSLFITDLTTSPFNVGTRLTQDDFTREQASELNQRYGSPLRSADEEQQVFTLLNGHPYLTSRALYELSANDVSLTELAVQAAQEAGPFGEHLRHLREILSQDLALTQIVRAVLRGEACTDDKGFYRLRSAGIIVGETPRDARIRCTLYADYLRRHFP